MKTLGEGRKSSEDEDDESEDTLSWVDKMRRKDEAKRKAEEKVSVQ